MGSGELWRLTLGLPLPLKQHSSVSVVHLVGRQMGASPGTAIDSRPALGQAGSHRAVLLRITSLHRRELLEHKAISRTSLHGEECRGNFQGLSTQEEKRATAGAESSPHRFLPRPHHHWHRRPSACGCCGLHQS